MSEGNIGGMNEALGVVFEVERPDRVEARMPIRYEITQPFGLVHGGATIALLESVASRGAELNCDLEKEQPFGVDVHVRHLKSGRAGSVLGVATLDREEPSHGRAGGIKQFWNVAAYDDAGDVMSEGVIVCRIVSKEKLAARG
ncbi:MAG: PaaI family thioesterase [Eggerthellaceae bacterium]|nr:PaaI family thioesterase [Eggerthellaceae bacterium]